MELEFSLQFFDKNSNIKFHENPSFESQAVPSGRTDGRRQRQKNLIVAFTLILLSKKPKKNNPKNDIIFLKTQPGGHVCT